MSLRENIRAIISDHFPDEKEAEGITNHLMYYYSKSNKGAFAGGVIVGVTVLAILLAYFG